MNWYGSDAYQRILPLRVSNAISGIILAARLAPEFTVAGFAAQIRTAIAVASAVEK